MDEVQDWLIAIKVATDKDSPFRGLVDLSEILDLPVETQMKIHDALSEEEKANLKELYG